MYDLLMKCVKSAIEQVGVEEFKKTSLFLSNEKVVEAQKEAA